MAIYKVDQNRLVEVPKTDFGTQGILERQDLQRLLRNQIDVLSQGLMVLATEFGHWEDSRRKLDLLCLDEQGNLVVVELKRTDTAEHADLQAIRYAAMVSPMTFEDAAGALARFRGNPPDLDLAKADILTFLNRRDISEGPFGKEVKVILAAADFGIELTTAVLWLNQQGLDIRCVRMVPYRLENGPLLVDIEQIIPLPEASTFQTRLRAKERVDRAQGNLTAAEALERAPENVRNLWENLKLHTLSLSEMAERQTQIYTAFDKGPNNPIISSRAFLGARPQVKLWMKVNPDSLELEPGFTRDIRQIGHWGVGDLEVLVFDEPSLEKAKILIQLCYQEN